MKKLITITAYSLFAIQHALAANVATWQDSANVTYLNSAITAAGSTPVTISALSSVGLTGIQTLFLLNSSNSGYSSAISSAAGDLDNFVNDGGTIVFFDRSTGIADIALDAILPSSFDFNFIGAYASQISFSTPSPFNVGLNDSSFDGGNHSYHGYIPLGSLPSGAVPLMEAAGAPSQIVTFSYTHGSGSVIYSSIPADYYLTIPSFNPGITASLQLYAQNIVAVPEPSSALLSAIAACGLLVRRRRN